jgi:hypothetical protein
MTRYSITCCYNKLPGSAAAESQLVQKRSLCFLFKKFNPGKFPTLHTKVLHKNIEYVFPLKLKNFPLN